MIVFAPNPTPSDGYLLTITWKIFRTCERQRFVSVCLVVFCLCVGISLKKIDYNYLDILHQVSYKNNNYYNDNNSNNDNDNEW